MPKDEDRLATQPAQRSRSGSRSGPLPGAWQAGCIAALAALLVGYAARPGDSTSTATAASVSQVADVAAQDLPAALDTLAWSPEQAAQFRDREACSRRLAWVTVAAAAGQPPGRIRLQSGAYLSPVFALTAAPVRVALPYPAPFPAGHGSIAIVGATDTVVALTPPWHVPGQAGLHAREVTWNPAGACPVAAK